MRIFSKKIFISTLLFFVVSHANAQAQYRLLFTGDVMMSREVQHEIIEKNYSSPWDHLKSFFSSADWITGNFEGAFGSVKQCVNRNQRLCFAVNPPMIKLIKNAGFNALSLENNHAMDLNNQGKSHSIQLLRQNGIIPLTFQQSPQFVKLGPYTIAMIALTEIPGADHRKIIVPSDLLLQKLRLAHSLANWVIVYVHWGDELRDWPEEQQRQQARWLINHGADVIIGHHPHVIQQPECVLGKPVFYSLGNHVFDQKYPETKQGLIAECFIKHNQLNCDGVKTVTAEGSSFPKLDVTSITNKVLLSHCSVDAKASLSINGYSLAPKILNDQVNQHEIILEGKDENKTKWIAASKQILSIESFRPDNNNYTKKYLFILEPHYSPIDQALNPRPYVYAVTDHGLVAKWRGSALAWPLLDATFIHDKAGNNFLCALHRNDSFVVLNSQVSQTRTAVYRWNDFGFSGVENSQLERQCKKIYSS